MVVRLAMLCVALALGIAASARVISVGPKQQYALPSQAAAVAKDGDTVEIAADGTYVGDFAVWRANDLTVRGINGRPHLDAAGKTVPNGKAIWVITGKNTTVEHIEFSGCAVPDKNGAGIRQEGPGLTVRDCYFHDNENGILTGANKNSDILIESSEFYHNGQGDGYSHNLYIGNVRSFTLQYCFSHGAKIGHQVKSRAEKNLILCNLLMDEADGKSSYLLQLPNGGESYVIGNVFQQGAHAENSTAISYADEGAKNAVQALYFINNTFVNARSNGKCLRVAGKPTLQVVNNLFTGTNAILVGAAETGENVTYQHNLVTETPGFVDAKHDDYHLTETSPARFGGIDPGKVNDFALLPAVMYLSPLQSVARPAPNDDRYDIGAFAYEEPKKETGQGKEQQKD